MATETSLLWDKIVQYWGQIIYLISIIVILQKIVTGEIRQNKAIKHLELLKEYFSNEKIEKLEKENEFVKYMTINIFPYFFGMSFDEIKRIINGKIYHKINFFYFIEFYKNELVDIQGNLTEKGESKIKWYCPNKDWFHLLWLVPLSLSSLYLVVVKLNPTSISDYIIIFFLIGIPEVIILNYFDKLMTLKLFKSKVYKSTNYTIEIDGTTFLAKVSPADSQSSTRK